MLILQKYKHTSEYLYDQTRMTKNVSACLCLCSDYRKGFNQVKKFKIKFFLFTLLPRINFNNKLNQSISLCENEKFSEQSDLSNHDSVLQC